MSLDPTAAADSQAWLSRAEACLRLRRWREARELAEARLAQEPQDGEAHRVRAQALWGLGRRGAAREAVREALRQDPQEGRFLWVLGSMECDEARGRAARTVAGQLLALRPDWAPAWRLAARAALLPGGDPRAGERHAREALRREPDSPDGMWLLGLSLLLQGRPRQAEAQFRQGLARDASHVGCLVGMVRCHLRARRLTQARDTARQAIALNPTSRRVEQVYALTVGSLHPVFRPLAWWSFSVGQWSLGRRVVGLALVLLLLGQAEAVLPLGWGVLLSLVYVGTVLYLLAGGALFRLAVARRWFL
ncbi:MAG: tetratricopeptide repeat protein [Thermaerobacter sp.]|nr:tetratricopeptide repeat protein [Thermaerobacter sp.]